MCIRDRSKAVYLSRVGVRSKAVYPSSVGVRSKAVYPSSVGVRSKAVYVERSKGSGLQLCTGF